MRSGAGTSAVDLPSGESLRPPLAWLATRSGGDRQAKRGDDVREEEEERRARKTRLPRASLPPSLVRVANWQWEWEWGVVGLGRWGGQVWWSGQVGPGLVRAWWRIGSIIQLARLAGWWVRCGAVRWLPLHAPRRHGTDSVVGRRNGPVPFTYLLD
jgi:hypothetical protein